VLALLGALALAPRAARAAEPVPGRHELTFDVGALSFGMTHAWRTDSPWLLFGGGGAIGASPLPPLGATYASNSHFDYKGHVEFAEVVQAQLFLRVEPASWLRVDGGVRVGVFVHSGETVGGGPFAGFFVAPALAWRWLWIGPRVSGNLVSEENYGNKSKILVLEYVMLRFVKSW